MRVFSAVCHVPFHELGHNIYNCLKKKKTKKKQWDNTSRAQVALSLSYIHLSRDPNPKFYGDFTSLCLIYYKSVNFYVSGF